MDKQNPATAQHIDQENTESPNQADPLATAVEQVKALAQQSPEQYLSDAIVPEGGE